MTVLRINVSQLELLKLPQRVWSATSATIICYNTSFGPLLCVRGNRTIDIFYKAPNAVRVEFGTRKNLCRLCDMRYKVNLLYSGRLIRSLPLLMPIESLMRISLILASYGHIKLCSPFDLLAPPLKLIKHQTRSPPCIWLIRNSWLPI